MIFVRVLYAYTPGLYVFIWYSLSRRNRGHLSRRENVKINHTKIRKHHVKINVHTGPLPRVRHYAGVCATVRAVEVGGGGVGAGIHAVGYAGDAVDVGLDDVDPASLGPGTVLCHPDFPLTPATRIQAKIVTLDAVRVPLLVGSTVVLHAYTLAVEAKVSALIHQLDPKSGEITKTRPRCLTRNMSALVELTPSR